MKKLVSLTLCVVIVMLISLTVVANASEALAPCVIPDVGLTVEIRSLSGSVAGLATVSANPLLTVATTVQIQREDNGAWTTVSTNNGRTLVSTTATAETGCTYRAYAVCVVTDSDGNVVGRLSDYSPELVY